MDATDPEGAGSTRRKVLEAAGAATAAGALATLFDTGAAAEPTRPTPATGRPELFEVEGEHTETVFPQGVASGGPTPEGVILWTRVAPDAHDPAEPLGVEVADDDSFDRVVHRSVIPASDVDAATDYTVKADLDGELDPGREYAYRFVYAGEASRVGRCRTLPAPDASPEALSFAVVSCNNYLHGYFGGFAHVAREDVDFLLHLGDFIYEYAGAGRQPGREIRLPSEEGVAHGLADFRHLYRRYRSDEFMRAALAAHTLVHTWDDHEIVNNRWWNYEADAPETQSHPRGDDPAFMRRLYVEGIKAYTEYVPSRIEYDPTGDELAEDAIQEDFRLYRSLQFGDLGELFVTDERLYRSQPPAAGIGPRDVGIPPKEATDDPDRTMLGRAQREWFEEGVVGSEATWTLWANEVFVSPLKYLNTEGDLYFNYDAWDGYRAERSRLLGRFAASGVENFVALTGDMHTYAASYLLTEYDRTYETYRLPDPSARVGVEFVTPAVTSDNIAAIGGLPGGESEGTIDFVVRLQNPHIDWFNSSRWGYVVVRATPDELTYTAYGVDRTVDDADAPKALLRRYRVPAGRTELREVERTDLDRRIRDVDGYPGPESMG
jgi:alkaline phosphatase D